MDESSAHYTRARNVHSVQFYLYKVLEWTKLMYGEEKLEKLAISE